MAKIGILGINARNLNFIRTYNKLKAIRLADDKLATKRVLQKAEIPTPRFYGVIKDVRDLTEFDWNRLPTSFAVKPNMGFSGKGIVILKSKEKKRAFLRKPLLERKWISGEGYVWNFEDLKTHIINILDGNFSTLRTPDTALIEKRLIRHPVFKKYVKKGLPDIRIVVFNKVPIMAMARFPTKRSNGKANLAQGAVGIGIDIASGITTTAMTKFPKRQIIESHPDSRFPLQGIRIPFWEDILKLSVEAQIVSGLGFLGIDIAIDKNKGPQVLELNARPGLDIQIANQAGLADRLERVEGLKIKTVEKGIRVAKELFGGDIEKRVEEISGREVIGIIEPIKILNKKGTRKIEVEAKIDTGAGLSAIDEDLAKKLGFKEVIRYYKSFKIKRVLTKKEVEELSKKKIWKRIKEHEDIVGVAKIFSAQGATYRIVIPLFFYLSGIKVITRVTVVERGELKYPMIVGRRDLKRFLVDPVKGKDVYSKY